MHRNKVWYDKVQPGRGALGCKYRVPQTRRFKKQEWCTFTELEARSLDEMWLIMPSLEN